MRAGVSHFKQFLHERDGRLEEPHSSFGHGLVLIERCFAWSEAGRDERPYIGGHFGMLKQMRIINSD